MNTLPAIHLRALEPEDLDLLYHIENDQQLWAMSSTNVPYSRYTLHDYIANSAGDIYTDRQVRLIIENSDRETVGVADLTNFDPKHQRAEIGLVIMSSRRNQGYAESAVHALHAYAKQTLHLHQVYAVIAADNHAALALFTQKMQYLQSATLDQWIYDGDNYHDAFVLQKIL